MQTRVLSIKAVVQALHAQEMSKSVVRIILHHMLDIEEREQQPAHSFDLQTGQEFERLRKVELPAILDSTYGQ